MELKSSQILIILSIYLIIPNNLNAQLSIKAQQRNRFEIRDGYRQLPTIGLTLAVIISQRARLSIDYQIGNLILQLTPQDVFPGN